MKAIDLEPITKAPRGFLVSAGRALNTSLDYLFYDVGALTPEEKDELREHAEPEGSILIVHPKSAARAITNLKAHEFITSQKRENTEPVDAVAVPGVGSSALGAAALARNVADSINRPVAAIVAGFGLADMVSEALGGWFVLGGKNRLRSCFAQIFDALDMKDHVWDNNSYESLVKEEGCASFAMDRFVYGCPDSTALLLLLHQLRTQIKVVVGHSKGNYAIENALEGLTWRCRLEKQVVPADLQVVTLGAVVSHPKEFVRVTQFIGGIDGFGMINSSPFLHPRWINGAWHSLNTALPGHISVGEALKLAGVR